MSRKRSLTPQQEESLIAEKVNNPNIQLCELAERYQVSKATVSRIMTSYYQSLGTSYHGNTKLTTEEKTNLVQMKSNFPSMTIRYLAYHFHTSSTTVSRILRKATGND